MGFYFRKSVRLGPLRFNLSKSGIGTSVGVKGFRLGAGPRGNYVLSLPETRIETRLGQIRDSIGAGQRVRGALDHSGVPR